MSLLIIIIETKSIRLSHITGIKINKGILILLYHASISSYLHIDKSKF